MLIIFFDISCWCLNYIKIIWCVKWQVCKETVYLIPIMQDQVLLGLVFLHEHMQEVSLKKCRHIQAASKRSGYQAETLQHLCSTSGCLFLRKFADSFLHFHSLRWELCLRKMIGPKIYLYRLLLVMLALI